MPAEARALAFEEGATCVPVLLSGDPADGILARARGAQPELLVLGSRARPVLGRARAARRVQARAACPVLAVTTPARGRPALRLGRPLLRTVARYARQSSHEAACPCCGAGGCRCCGTPPIARRHRRMSKATADRPCQLARARPSAPRGTTSSIDSEDPESP